MKAVVQRVLWARVRSGDELLGEIEAGLAILVGVLRGDGPREAERLAERIARLRIFSGDEGRMERSLLETGGAALVVSQFTLAADGTRGGRKGRRPSFDRAAPAAEAEPLCERFVARLRALGVPTRTGRFGARMLLEIAGDGPVTLVVEEAPPAAALKG